MVEEALLASRGRARSGVAGRLEKRLSQSSITDAGDDKLRTAINSRNVSGGSPLHSLLNLVRDFAL